LIVPNNNVIAPENAPPTPIRSIALCGISTGIFGYPLDNAAEVAVSQVRRWLEDGGAELVDRVVFVVFLEKELAAYERTLQVHFPKGAGNEGSARSDL
jgi:O-acetyl-ADP-ribose deacetylase (regulator of RNase III)